MFTSACLLVPLKNIQQAPAWGTKSEKKNTPDAVKREICSNCYNVTSDWLCKIVFIKHVVFKANNTVIGDKIKSAT